MCSAPCTAPARLPSALCAPLQREAASCACVLLQAGGGRTVCALLGYDFMVTSDGRPFLIEVNANPLLAAQCGWHEKLLQRMSDDYVALALQARDGARARRASARRAGSGVSRCTTHATASCACAAQALEAERPSSSDTRPKGAGGGGGGGSVAAQRPSSTEIAAAPDSPTAPLTGGGLGPNPADDDAADADAAASADRPTEGGPTAGGGAEAGEGAAAARLGGGGEGRPPLDGVECVDDGSGTSGFVLLVGRPLPGSGSAAAPPVFAHASVGGAAVLERSAEQRAAAAAVAEPAVVVSAPRLLGTAPTLSAVKAAREAAKAARDARLQKVQRRLVHAEKLRVATAAQARPSSRSAEKAAVRSERAAAVAAAEPPTASRQASSPGGGGSPSSHAAGGSSAAAASGGSLRRGLALLRSSTVSPTAMLMGRGGGSASPPPLLAVAI